MILGVSISDWLKRAQDQLKNSSDSPRLDAELLVMQLLDVNRSWLFAWPEKILKKAQLERLGYLLEQRLEGKPMAHILGFKEFWSLPIQVNDSTLIPRPDTELLVEWSLELPLKNQARVVDLGTGTGAIALALASERPSWLIEAVELSSQAVSLARANAQSLDLDMKVIQGDWFTPLSGKYDLIVSNPPYIDANDEHLSRGDVRFEPSSALVSDDAGLKDLHWIVQTAPGYLEECGWLLVEHGYDQTESVIQLLNDYGYQQVETGYDLGGNPRVSGGCWVGC